MKYLILFPIIVFMPSCTPQSEAQVKTVETDLCKARTVEKGLEAADSSLAPKPDSVRAKIEVAEDAFCATIKP